MIKQGFAKLQFDLTVIWQHMQCAILRRTLSYLPQIRFRLCQNRRVFAFPGVSNKRGEVFATMALKPESYIGISFNSHFCWQQ